jgi:hypothetical protein
MSVLGYAILNKNHVGHLLLCMQSVLYHIYNCLCTPFIILQDLLLPHLLDAMHIEKNVTVSLVKTMSNAKGTKSDSLA